MKNKFGLLAADIDAIILVLNTEPKIEQAILFGSRAKGNYKNGSDIDLALKGHALDFDTINRISYLLNEESLLPYKFDILNYHSITEIKLMDHIKRIGIELYSKK